MRDYVGVAVEYAQWAIQPGNKRVGKWLRLGAERFLKDLERAAERIDFTFSEDHAVHACQFIENLPHVEGEWNDPETGLPKPTICMYPAQVFATVQLFGFRAHNGKRRYTKCLLGVARKQGKSSWSAGVMLYVFTCENETGPKIFTAATTGDQARLIFDYACKMIEKTPELKEAFNLEVFANAIVNHDAGGSFKPINAKASTQDGLNPYGASFDEVHAHKSPDLINVLTSAAGARKAPLFLYTTTEGYENAGPWRDIRHTAKIILEGVVKADHFLIIYFAVDDEDDEFDEECWHKANPFLASSPELLKAIRDDAAEARIMPTKMAEFRIKRLMRPSESAEGAINLLKWKRCNGELPWQKLQTAPCFGGLDLASTSDLNAFALVWIIDSHIYAMVKFWVPENAVAQRNNRGTVKYSGWVESGHIKMVPGEIQDYAVIDKDIGALMSKFNVRKIAYDSWNSVGIIPMLQARNAPLFEFSQIAKSYHPPIREVERAYTSGALSHGGNPVLQWNAANLIFKPDTNMNLAPDKRKSPDKIDGMVAMYMAVGAALAEPAPVRPRVYAL